MVSGPPGKHLPKHPEEDTGKKESPSSHYLQQTILLLLSSDHYSYWGNNRMTDAMTCDGAFGVAPRQDFPEVRCCCNFGEDRPSCF
ncbi:uncharacterized protein LOC120442844 isoform X3 [Oreochromis aureus]|uniref:uncharacterized protein LOC120442844 isoform X3 n=1 Tax=Oreochromis aureus TaxID=47969 RepID=UPI001953872D|nr:uncharacterized protein LOC120442844 isoform X3 [Oreochromis aureus]